MHQYVLYQCSQPGCRVIESSPGECPKHGEALGRVKMTDAKLWLTAENALRAIAGGHMEDPVNTAKEALFAMYPSIADSEMFDAPLAEHQVVEDTPPASGTERLHPDDANMPEDFGDAPGGGSIVISKQGGD